MEQKCDRLYPSAPSENIDVEQQLEKKINDVNSFFIIILVTLKNKLLISKIKTINQKRDIKNIKP